MEYLGALISKDGRPDSEISRRIGIASADFRALCKLWSHANVSKRDKLQYFRSLVVARLVYGLSTIWMVTAQKRRLDGFYCRCLRRILRIPAAFVSRVSNAKVLAEADCLPLSTQILHKQLVLMGKVARAPASSPLRHCTFIDETLRLQIGRFVRRRGRPRRDWSTCVFSEGCRLLGRRRFETILLNQELCSQTLTELFSRN